MDVLGVRVEMPASSPVVLLRERGGDRYLPVWIGATEATAIAYAQQGVVPPRPLTHDLLKNVIDALGRTLKLVRIDGLIDGVFHSTLVFDNGVEVSSRTSDAIALALRTGTEVVTNDELLAQAGVLSGPDDDEAAHENEEQEVEQFKEFLDTISPEDFGDPGPH